MSWYDALVPRRVRRKAEEAKSVPEGLWTKCPGCSAALHDAELAKMLGVCRKCGHHQQLPPAQRAEMLFDEGADLHEIAANLSSRDFLGFTDLKSYKDRLKKAASKEDPHREALRVYQGEIGGKPAVLACFDWSFMGGSMGSVVGERFVRGVDVACDRGTPLIVCSTSGGARMQEGLVSLMQMAKTTAAVAKLGSFSLPFVSVLCNPTTGGVAASFALIGDVIIAEPGATVGFAGERVIRQTVREELPEGFQRSEFLLEHGSVDMIVPRSEQRGVIASLCGIMLDGRGLAD